MRSILLSGGIYTFLSGRESDFINNKEFPVMKKDLSPNERLIVKSLTSRGVLIRTTKDKETFFRLNTNKMGKQ